MEKEARHEQARDPAEGFGLPMWGRGMSDVRDSEAVRHWFATARQDQDRPAVNASIREYVQKRPWEGREALSLAGRPS